MLKKVFSFLTLFTSLSTLVCCAIPALFVVLGLGATFAGIVSQVPQLIWISEHKIWVFGLGAVLLIAGGGLQWYSRKLLCPVDPKLAEACKTTRDWSSWIYYSSVGLYLIGAAFAFGSGFFGSTG